MYPVTIKLDKGGNVMVIMGVTMVAQLIVLIAGRLLENYLNYGQYAS